MAKDDDKNPGLPEYWHRLLEESNAAFEAAPLEPPSLDTLRSLYSHVLRIYGFTCAMTGQTFEPPADFLHEHLEIVPIRPLALGGAIHIDNFLCLERGTAKSFRLGHIGIGPALELIVDLSRIDPEILEKLNLLGRLRLPEPSMSVPDPRALAFHREHIFLRHDERS